MKNPIPFLRQVALVEAISYLLLLAVAMPLKYWADLPMAVRVMGSIHGLLFVVFCWALVRVQPGVRWPFGRAVLVFVASLLPLVPFWLDRRMQGWAEQWPNAGR